jgi:NADH:ubiquinone oxidoreductase subunit 6 (subunit J)
MILNRPEDEPVAPSGRIGQVLGGLAILYLVARLVIMLINVQPPNPEVANAAPPALPEQCVAWSGPTCIQTERYDWGSMAAVGTDLFNDGLFPFEAISILLVVAVVGASAIARPLHSEDDAKGGVA